MSKYSLILKISGKEGKRVKEKWTKSLDNLLAETEIISNFTCVPQLIAFTIKEEDNLEIINWEGEKRFLLIRKKKISDFLFTDIRILFKRKNNDEELIKTVKQKFSPSYVAYNLIPGDQLKEINFNNLGKYFATRNELIINIENIAYHQDKNLLRAYRRALRRNGKLQLIPAEKKDEERINEFLDRWCEQIEKIGHLGLGQTASNDRRLINIFLGDERIKCWLLIDKRQIIGLSFYTYHPSNPEGLAVKIILKNLRGYTKLGQYLMIEEAKKLKENGFKWALMGGNENPTQARFKEEFMKGGRRKKYYSTEVYCDKILERIFSRLPLEKRIDFLRSLWG